MLYPASDRIRAEVRPMTPAPTTPTFFSISTEVGDAGESRMVSVFSSIKSFLGDIHRFKAMYSGPFHWRFCLPPRLSLLNFLSDPSESVLLVCGHCSFAPRRHPTRQIHWWSLASGSTKITRFDLSSPFPSPLNSFFVSKFETWFTLYNLVRLE